ncbi:MAG: IS3 family transposase [Clostridia bacterium]|nr:IS3 family transposase [Clostridia bacterium]
MNSGEKPQTYEKTRLLIGEWIRFYNYRRIQIKTKPTPMEFRSRYVVC